MDRIVAVVPASGRTHGGGAMRLEDHVADLGAGTAARTLHQLQQLVWHYPQGGLPSASDDS